MEVKALGVMKGSKEKAETLRALEQISARLGVILRYNDLGRHGFKAKSGYCRLKGANLIIMDKSLSTDERTKVLRKELGKIDSENIFIEPRFRDLIWP